MSLTCLFIILQVNGQLQTVDELIDILMTNLYEMNMQNCINIIIIADHGNIYTCFIFLYIVFVLLNVVFSKE